MKYQEIKKRLDKCQVRLELLQTKQAATKSSNIIRPEKAAIKVLKESIKRYKKLLKEGEESYLLTLIVLQNRM